MILAEENKERESFFCFGLVFGIDSLIIKGFWTGGRTEVKKHKKNLKILNFKEKNCSVSQGTRFEKVLFGHTRNIVNGKNCALK